MKIDLKKKVMLAVLAGGMLCANGAFAGEVSWYGTPRGFVDSEPNPAVLTGINLTIIDSTTDGNGNNVTVPTYIYGGYNEAEGLEVKNNSITFNTTDAMIRAFIWGGYGGTATGNSVIIYSGTFNTAIRGGSSFEGSVTNNLVSIYGGNFKRSVYRGVSDAGFIYGGFSGSGNAEGNIVTITAGSFEEDVVIYGGWSFSGNATGNIVTIFGGNFEEEINVYGAYSYSGTANNNTINIEGGTFNDGYKLYGGYVASGISSSNILNFKTKITGKATEVKFFQEMNFFVSTQNIGDTMLNTQTMSFDNSGTKVNVNVTTGKYKEGSVITLVNAVESVTGIVTQGTIPTGSELNLLDDAYITDKKLTLTFTSDYIVPAKPDEKAVLEGIAASLAFVNQGADIVAGSGIDGLSVADSDNPTIAAFSGNKTRYNTGSHVDIHGWNALVGVALNNKKSFSHGVFVELGNGDIDTYAALDGSGSSDYKGGGYMLRKDLGKGWGIDGAVRAGRVETSWDNNTKGSYEAKQTYYGAHVTFNKMLKEYNEQKLNGYLRYSFTHLGSDSVKLDDVNYGFDSVNSHRTRLGARMVDEGQNGFELYYGAAWEYGFGGDCDATMNGVTTSGPAVDGSSAVFEVGGTWSDKKWEINAGLEGYLGTKRGVAGGMNFIYKF